MPLHTIIRPERPADIAVIAEITRDAFRSHPHSDHFEHVILDALRGSGALSVSLVAEVNAQVAGHIAFSPVSVADGAQDWYGLGPMAVKPELQGQGIGRVLVQNGLAALRRLDAQGCVVVGERGFYGRFGFEENKELVLEGVPQEYFLSLAIGEKSARGQVTYHDAFRAQG